MYHTIVRLKLKRAFEHINAGRYERLLPEFAPAHRHVMYGSHALGGERNNLASTARWYARLAHLLRGLQFDVHAIVVAGWPWKTAALVTWTDHFSLPDGSVGSNQGVHEFELRWGKVTVMQVHCDTERLADYCRRLGEMGVAEALQQPIDDRVAVA